MPRPNTSNLIEVLNTQALTEKSSDKISLSQNPDKSGRKLVIFTKAWQEWKETCDFTHSLTRVEGNLWFWPKVEIWNCSHGLNSWRIWLIFSPVIRLTRDHNPWTVWPDRTTFFSGPFWDFGNEWFCLLMPSLYWTSQWISKTLSFCRLSTDLDVIFTLSPHTFFLTLRSFEDILPDPASEKTASKPPNCKNIQVGYVFPIYGGGWSWAKWGFW